MVSSKRRELIERGLIKKLKKGKPKKLAREDIDLNKIPDMLIDTPPSPAPAPTPVVVATSSRRKEKSISSIVNATPLVDDDQVIVRERGRGRGRGRGSSENNANVDRFQDPSRFNDVVDLNKGDTHPGSLTSPVLSVKATQHNQQVESIAYDAEPSKNDNISKKNKSIEPLDETNIPHPPPPPPLVSGGSDGDSGGINTNVAQVQDTTETAGGSSNGSTRVVNERVHPNWEGPSPLLPISTCYIKISDVNKPFSYIMKYLAHILSLQSEDEVELHMLGMLIHPDLPIKHLEKLWLRVAPHSGKSSAKVGAFAEEFVMVLKYSRSHTKLN
ncbi:hypothetical protein H5410_030284 [Solanum commersonii]|uniref:Uncharacterized protein n=1 Tax=Solanum commersonii TaxID=4109 RepID=A0A9J5YF97_SOLCO|nr:hypothetical protein H5410_030284 [Solanum commersonii]